MSHGHSHPVEENPKVASSGAFYFVLSLVGLVVGLFLFVQSMSGHDEGHDASHSDAHGAASGEGHSWAGSNHLEYSTVALSGGKVVEEKAAPAITIVANDSVPVKVPQTVDSAKVEKK